MKAGKVKLEPPNASHPGQGGAWEGLGEPLETDRMGARKVRLQQQGRGFSEPPRSRRGWSVGVCLVCLPLSSPSLPSQYGPGLVIPVSQGTPLGQMPRAAWPFLPQPC